MKTSDFRFSLSASQLNETLQQKFGGSIDIDNFDPTQLVKAAKLIESKILAFKQAGFNATLENEEFHKLQLMQDIVHTRMKELVRESKKEKMSKAAKGMMKYGKDGMKALAKAGKDGKNLDKVRDKYNKYDESAKPDFLDMDKDGNKKEPMKKALKDKKKTVKEGFWGGALGGLGAGLATGFNPWAMGGGYLLGSKAGDDIFGEGMDDEPMSHRALKHAIMYRKHHHEGDIENAYRHKQACSECGGQIWHGDMGECWHMHPEMGDEPHNIDEGIGKYLLPAAGLAAAGLGGYALGNPEAFGGIGGQAIGMGKELGGQAMDMAQPYLDKAGELLKESDTSMCELAMHHAVEYRKNHKMGNLKHCGHHKDNIENCGGKIWHDGTGEVFFSHHGHKNGVPELVKEYTIGGDHNIEGLAKIGAGIGGGYYGSQLGGMAGDALGAMVNFPGAGRMIGSVGGALAGGGLANHAFDKANKAHFNIEEEVEDDEDTMEGKKMSPKDKKLAAKYPPKDKITRGDVITAAKEKKKTSEQVDRMLKESIRFYLREGEEGKAEVIMAVKDMVDKFTGWSEDIAQMQANTAMEMADSIRDELGSQVSAQFTQVATPALDAAFQAVKAAREALNSMVGVITGEGQAPGSMGGMPGAPMGGMPAPGGMPGAPMDGGMPAPGSAPPLAPEGEEEENTTGRAKRESVERSLRIAKLLVGR